MILVTGLVLSNAITSLAGWEQQTDGAWKYKDDTTNVYYLNGWYWIDGNGDNVAECYYLDENGIMSANSIVDNYTINAEGQWTVDGVVQTKVVNKVTTNNNSGVQAGTGGNVYWFPEDEEFDTTPGWGGKDVIVG